MRRLTLAGCTVAVGLTLAGCADDTAQQDASGVATRFLQAVAAGDAETGCALLAPRTREDLATSDGQPCAQSLPVDRLGAGGVADVAVWSDRAQVSTDRGALFLAEFDSGWLVTAAGCQPNGEAPYKCVVGA